MTLAPTPLTIETARGALGVELVDTRILLVRIRRVLDVQLARSLMLALDAWHALGATDLQAFVDGEALRDYESEARSVLTGWTLAHRASFGAIHVLVANRTVAWGVQVVDTVVGGLFTAHHVRPSFESAYRAAVRGAPIPASAANRLQWRFGELAQLAGRS